MKTEEWLRTELDQVVPASPSSEPAKQLLRMSYAVLFLCREIDILHGEIESLKRKDTAGVPDPV